MGFDLGDRLFMFEFEIEGALQGHAVEDLGCSSTGTGVGTEAYTGRACVAALAEDAIDRLRAGDVLVTTPTTPTFEAVMAIARAVVTEHDGLMSRTAIVCREQQIPAVLGVAGATIHIADGHGDGDGITVNLVLGTGRVVT